MQGCFVPKQEQIPGIVPVPALLTTQDLWVHALRGNLELPHKRVNMCLILHDRQSAVLKMAKAACWGTFQKVCVHALERSGSLRMASAFTSGTQLDFGIVCVLIVQFTSLEATVLFAALLFFPGELESHYTLPTK